MHIVHCIIVYYCILIGTTPYFSHALAQEIVFHLAFCEMAKAAAPLLRLIAHAQDAVQQGDDDEVLEVIQSIAVCIEQIQKAFMKIIPDPNATNGIVEPLVWAKTGTISYCCFCVYMCCDESNILLN